MELEALFAAAIDEDVLRYQFVKKKGYVRLHTNKGDLNLELHCDLVGVAPAPWPLCSGVIQLPGLKCGAYKKLQYVPKRKLKCPAFLPGAKLHQVCLFCLCQVDVPCVYLGQGPSSTSALPGVTQQQVTPVA